MSELHPRIRTIVLEHGRLGGATPDDATDLYALGMTSHATVAVMLALEAAFDVEFPDEFLTRQVFESVDNIAEAVTKLLGPSAPSGGA